MICEYAGVWSWQGLSRTSRSPHRPYLVDEDDGEVATVGADRGPGDGVVVGSKHPVLGARRLQDSEGERGDSKGEQSKGRAHGWLERMDGVESD